MAAASAASVWIVGPPGSGRQRTAEAIHYGADGVVGSLIPLDCAVLSGDLVISTVQAFSARRPSAERPTGSTLLLADVDLLPSDVQTGLAQVLCGRAFPLRLIATARQPPEELLKLGKFRQDLGLALSTISIHLPPLTERREDLPLVAQLFLEEVNSRGGKQIASFTSEALDALDAYPWPGNLDELAAMVAVAHQRAQGPQIALGDLPEDIHLAAAAAARPRKPEETIVLDDFLARVQRELIGRAIRRAKGNKTRAARLLGMTRPRLYRRMVQLGLEENKP
jgi:DNA-binding NtrC family response regulator